MPLESITIINFQNHEELKIDFDPQITTIVGPSDVGKSAALRALRWIATNQPSGDSFIRDSSDGSTAILRIDGHEITRRRMTNGENKYELDGQEYSSFGTGGVPDPIAKLLSVDKLNFIGQHDPPFWFCESAAEVARNLNSIVDLGIIDKAHENIGKTVRKYQEAVRFSKERLATIKEQRDSLKWVEEAQAAYNELDAISKELQKITDQKENLTKCMVGIMHIETELEWANSYRASAVEVGKLGVSCKELSNKQQALSNLLLAIGESMVKTMYKNIDFYQVEEALLCVRNHRTEITKLTSMAYAAKESAALVKSYKTIDFHQVEEAFLSCKDGKVFINKLSNLINEIKSLSKILDTRQDECEIAERELIDACDGICPVCGGELKAA